MSARCITYRNSRFEDIYYQLKDIEPNDDKLKSVHCFCGKELYKVFQLSRHIEKKHPDECQSKRRRLELSLMQQVPLSEEYDFIPDYVDVVADGNVQYDVQMEDVTEEDESGHFDIIEPEIELSIETEPEEVDEFARLRHPQSIPNDDPIIEESRKTVNDLEGDGFFKGLMLLIMEHKYVKCTPSKHINLLVYQMISHFESVLNLSKTKIELYKKVIKSDFLQDSYIEKYFTTYIKPEIVQLENSTGKCRYSYIPIRKVVQKYLRNESIRNKILNEAKVTNLDKHIDSLSDAKVFPRMQRKAKIELNCDEVEISPGMGSDQKFLNVYVSLADLPFEERSRATDIEMLIMVNRKDLDSLGLEDPLSVLYARLRKDLDELMQNGVDMNIGGEVIHIDVTLSCICGDNLGVYELQGFKKSFNNNCFVCRFCLAPGNKKRGADNIQCPSKHHLLIDTDPEALVLRDFPFDGLNGDITRFNCCPPDEMHDINEGVGEDVLNYILTSIVTPIEEKAKAKAPKATKKTTKAATAAPVTSAATTSATKKPTKKYPSKKDIEAVQSRFKNFKFYEGKPTLNWYSKTGFRLRGTALQKLEALLRLESILFPAFNPTNFKAEWDLFMSVKEFILLSYSPVLTRKDLIRMTILSNDIVENWKVLKPDLSVYCKLHHLSHYGDLTDMFGPLYLYSCFRYEHKHQYCKNVARVMKNFLNPALTIHTKHQYMIALMEEKSDFLNTNFWPDVATERPIFMTDQTLPTSLKKLPSQLYPYRLNQNVLRRTKHNKEYWFYTSSFLQGEDGKIYCKGSVFDPIQERGDDGKVKGPKLYNNSLKFLKKVFSDDHYILFSDLHFSNDYLFIDDKNNNMLVKWIR